MHTNGQTDRLGLVSILSILFIHVKNFGVMRRN
jgi:hypothetical protein